MGFLRRIGGAVAAPRVTLRALIDEGRGGLSDLLLLLALQVTGAELPRLARAGWQVIDTGVFDGLSSMLSVFTGAMIVPLGAVAIGTVALRVADREGYGQLDAAALCAVPAVALQLLVGLVLALLPSVVPPGARTVALGAGGVWYVALLFLAANESREARAEQRRAAQSARAGGSGEG